jgi:hypothetical protein
MGASQFLGAMLAGGLVLLHAPSSAAQSNAPQALQRQFMIQEQHRAQFWGTGPDVRFARHATEQWFQGMMAWPNVPQAGVGTLRSERISHATLPVTAPVEHGRCRMIDYSALPAGDGASMAWTCPLDQSFAYAMVSFERASFDPTTIAREMIRIDQDGLGISPPQCTQVPPPDGLDRMEFCESSFEHAGTQDGRMYFYVGSSAAFFVKASTACNGHQCEEARTEFGELVAELRFASPGQ